MQINTTNSMQVEYHYKFDANSMQVEYVPLRIRCKLIPQTRCKYNTTTNSMLCYKVTQTRCKVIPQTRCKYNTTINSMLLYKVTQNRCKLIPPTRCKYNTIANSMLFYKVTQTRSKVNATNSMQIAFHYKLDAILQSYTNSKQS